MSEELPAASILFISMLVKVNLELKFVPIIRSLFSNRNPAVAECLMLLTWQQNAQTEACFSESGPRIQIRSEHKIPAEHSQSAGNLERELLEPWARLGGADERMFRSKGALRLGICSFLPSFPVSKPKAAFSPQTSKHGENAQKT